MTNKKVEIGEDYLLFLIDLKKSLGVFLEQTEKEKAKPMSSSDRRTLIKHYNSVSRLHDVVRSEIGLMSSTYKIRCLVPRCAG